MAEQSTVEVGNAMILLASTDNPFSKGIRPVIWNFTTNNIDQLFL